jgi:valyl-tRNA synthetase
MTIQELVAEARLRRETLKKMSLGPIPADVVEILNAEFKSSIDFSEYEFFIDTFGIRHTLKHHGIAKIEDSRGQVIVTDKDFELIIDILKDPDLVFYDGKSNLGKDVFQFQKRVGNRYIILKEVRVARKQLAFLSMRIIKAKKR